MLVGGIVPSAMQDVKEFDAVGQGRVYEDIRSAGHSVFPRSENAALTAGFGKPIQHIQGFFDSASDGCRRLSSGPDLPVADRPQVLNCLLGPNDAHSGHGGGSSWSVPHESIHSITRSWLMVRPSRMSAIPRATASRIRTSSRIASNASGERTTAIGRPSSAITTGRPRAASANVPSTSSAKSLSGRNPVLRSMSVALIGLPQRSPVRSDRVLGKHIAFGVAL